MLNILESSSIGTIVGLEPSAHVTAILVFLKNHLEGFIKLYFEKYPTISNEPGITQKLEFYLTLFLKEELSTFNLTKEYIEDTYTGQSPKSDLAFYLNGDDVAIFCIEAKRLPTPGSGREKEYIYSPGGKSGGIERFKKEIHGKGLTHSAIIAYIQKNGFHYWFKKINKWISDLIKTQSCGIEWNEKDSLVAEYYKPQIAKLNSTNKIEIDYIHLTHFWIDLRSTRDIVRDRLYSVKKHSL